MKKLSKIKLTVLNRNEIADKEQRLLMGGGDYKCGCMSACMDELCQCLTTQNAVPLETILEKQVNSSILRESVDKTTAEFNRDRNHIP